MPGARLALQLEHRVAVWVQLEVLLWDLECGENWKGGILGCRIGHEMLSVFDWETIEEEHERLEKKTMINLWFKDLVFGWERCEKLTDFRVVHEGERLFVKFVASRITAELSSKQQTFGACQATWHSRVSAWEQL